MTTDPVELYLARLAPSSRRVQGQALRDAARLLPEWPQVQHSDVALLQSRLLEKQSPATVRRTISAVLGVVDECWRLGLITAEERARIRDQAPIRFERLPVGRALSLPQLELMLAKASLRDRALLLVLAATGMRRAEAAALTIRDVQRSGTGYTLRIKGKGDKERKVFIDNGAAQELAHWIRKRPRDNPDAPLFGLNGANVRTRMHELAKRAGVGWVTAHDLRRTYASLALGKADLLTVQKTMGHASPKMTARYDMRGEDAQRNLAKALGI